MASAETIQTLYRIAAGGIGAGALIAVGIEVTAIAKAYIVRPQLISPTEPRHGEPTDPAWADYFAGQGSVDFQELLAQQGALYRRALRGWWTRFPFFVVSLPILLVAGLVLVGFSLVFVLALIALVIVAEVIFWLIAGTVRLTDALYSLVKRSEASCPVCYQVMERPAYVCPGCLALHRDIRAGRLGALFRTCTCGHRLPTGVLRAAWQLNAVCQHCGAHVHRGAAVLQDVRIPVFGDPHAGKTRLIFAGMHELVGKARKAGLTVTFPDELSRQRAEMGLEQIAMGKRTIKTEWQLEPALTCQIGSGMNGALLHIFDAAGERFRGGDGHDDLRYMDDGHTLLFVVDPVAVPAIREQLVSQLQTEELSEHLPEHGIRSPEGAYGEVVSRVRTGGTDTKRQRLAVVVTKADVLVAAGLTPPSESEALRTWLYDSGMHNVVLAAGREFREVQYFAVASVEAEHSSPDLDASAPFRWALATRGFKLPTSTALLQKAVAE